jgi:YfiH family protein
MGIVVSDWHLSYKGDHAFGWNSQFEFTAMVRHGVTSRQGNLNLSARTEPDRGQLKRNRIEACSFFGAELTDCTIPNQSHGNRSVIVTEVDRGRGGWPPEDGAHDVDALVTNVPGVLLGITIADCLPIFLLDPVNKVIGAVHSGWRGTAGCIVRNTIALMREHYETDPRDLLAAIGPGICGMCYEVGDEVKSALMGAGAGHIAFSPSPASRWMLDLNTVVKQQLLDEGIPAGRISVSPWCTSCHNLLFYSHRKEGPMAGRMGAFIKII